MPAAEPPATPSWRVSAPEHRLSARILIADDNSVARTTIHALLDWHSFQVCGEAKDGNEAIEKVIELKPDIILLDINMPGMNGVRAAYEIRRISPATKIVFLTIHDTPAVMVGLRVWSHGFVTKSATGTELIPTLNRLVGTPDKKPPAKPAKSKSRRAAAGK
ncbi:MAG: hypothetical protein DMG32_10085 [Acidobacteria bacterium]|nr:MAG: hypothetical protein DMG32_10085 [Acidobacteriota bacterium]